MFYGMPPTIEIASTKIHTRTATLMMRTAIPAHSRREIFYLLATWLNM